MVMEKLNPNKSITSRSRTSFKGGWELKWVNVLNGLELFKRYESNPILTAQDWPYPVNSVFNAAAALVEGTTILLVRVEDFRGISHLTVARSNDGIGGWEIDAYPTFEPAPEEWPEEIWDKAQAEPEAVLSFFPAERRSYDDIMAEIKQYHLHSFIAFISGQRPIDKFPDYVMAIKRMGIHRAEEILNEAWRKFYTKPVR